MARPTPPLTPSGEQALLIARTQPQARIRSYPAQTRRDGWRELVESVVIAFVLAFLFRTFVAEAFVIPTGSMAQTLFGRHKDVHCTACGTRYQVGASDEIVRDTNYLDPSQRVNFGFCPNCGFHQNIREDVPFKGDRILVNKFPYEFADPKPFDVVVFKFPVDPKTNYIKRMIGLPGETVYIEQGDIFTRAGNLEEREIRRKPLNKQRTMQMPVYDHDHPAPALLAQGWPERWAPLAPATGAAWTPETNGWQPEPETRSFRFETPANAGRHWLRYQHLVPSVADWERAAANLAPETVPQPMLISDYYAYNSGYWHSDPITPRHVEDATLHDSLGKHWVGDLTVAFDVEVIRAQGELLLELVESERRYRCAIDLKTGRAALYYLDGLWARGEADQGNEDQIRLGEADTPLSQPGTYRLTFANVDDRLSLWVRENPHSPLHTVWGGDQLIEFGGADVEPLAAPTFRGPTKLDLYPVGVAATGADLRVAHLVLDRDIYYTSGEDNDVDMNQRRARLSNPEEYNRNIRSKSLQFQLSEDEFLVLGDNSPRSADSRLWENPKAHHAHAVERSHLIGKAFFIYWPHGVPFLNDGKGYPADFHQIHPELPGAGRPHDLYTKFNVPFYPQVTRMKLIH